MVVDPIIPFGPSITHREIGCVADAVAVGWHAKRRNYVHAFESSVSRSMGQKHAFATANPGAALLIALRAMGVGPGDEVLVPELAEMFVAASIMQAGATPVFCDVDPLHLCLCPVSTAAKVTERTKAMIPVHMYGTACPMGPLLSLAAQHKIFVIEQASQGFGSVYKGRQAGSCGHMTVVSFTDDQLVVAGEGGMLLASHDELFRRAVRLGSDGRSADNPFVYDSIGLSCGMSNVQAALGVAQMERLSELLEKKQQLFLWYQEQLAGVAGIRLNAPVDADCVSSQLMTVAMLEDAGIIRHHFLQRLHGSGVLAQPVPYPLSSMPMFTKGDNPVAYSAGVRAFVLPSAHNRTYEEVVYVCDVVKDLLANPHKEQALVSPSGWLAYKADVLQCLADAKSSGLILPFVHNEVAYTLQAITQDDVQNDAVISFLATLQQNNAHIFLHDRAVTKDFIRSMLQRYAERSRDFILFLVKQGNELLGHIGLDDFSFQQHECVAEALIMKPDVARGLPTAASDTLYIWAKERLGIRRVFNHVLASNTGVRLMASAQGFKEVNKTPLFRAQLSEGSVLRPMYVQGHDAPDDAFVFSAKEL